MDELLNHSNRGAEPFGLETSRLDRARSLDALHELELVTGSAAPGRETQWLKDVREALAILEAALGTQQMNASNTKSAFSDIEQDAPRLARRVVQLRDQYGNLSEAARELRIVVDAAAPESLDVADLRRHLEQLGTELRYLRGREADLIYEAYTVDLGVGD